MLTLKLSSFLSEIPNGMMLLSQILIGCSPLSQEFSVLIGWYWIIMRRQLYPLKCPIPKWFIGVTLQQSISFLWQDTIAIPPIEDEISGACCLQLVTSSEVLLEQCQLCNSMCDDIDSNHITDTVNKMSETSFKISRLIIQLMQVSCAKVKFAPFLAS